MSEPLRVLVVGVGNMGASHARAYQAIDGFEICGLMSRSITRQDLPEDLDGLPRFEDLGRALLEARPDAVSINSYPDTHASYAIRAMEAGCHVFVEKPIATTVEDARRVVECAERTGRKLVIGYILRVHPAWQELIRLGRGLGKPLVMRMNLNQQSTAGAWRTHKALMQSLTPIVDCGVHYVDVMCQLTGARPVRVHGIGARLSDEVAVQNYGHLHVVFEDGSVGWYEAGWGPMASEVAYFVKDVWGPEGSVSIAGRGVGSSSGGSADVDSHTRTESLLLHHAELRADGELARPDEWIDTSSEPDHQELCVLEQKHFLRAIREDLDLSQSMADAVSSLAIVLAAQESIDTGRSVEL